MFTFMQWLKEYVEKLKRNKNDKLPDNDTTDHIATAMKGDS